MLWFCIGKKMQVIFKQELLIFIFFNMLLRNRHQNLKLFSFLFTELHKKWTCEAVTIIETPPMVAVGVVAYVKAPRGLRSLNTLWAQHLSEDIKRKFYKIWCNSKKKAFTKYSNKFESDEGKKDIRFQLEKMKNYRTVIRVLPHTQLLNGLMQNTCNYNMLVKPLKCNAKDHRQARSCIRRHHMRSLPLQRLCTVRRVEAGDETWWLLQVGSIRKLMVFLVRKKGCRCVRRCCTYAKRRWRTGGRRLNRHYYMKDVNIFIDDPGNKKSILAVSALPRAMKEINKVGNLSCVWRQEHANVVIGLLTPNAESFYFNALPFAKDVREFQFQPFSNLPKSLQPNEEQQEAANEEQQEAADKLVMMMDMAPAGREEAVWPDFTPNPVLEV